MKNRETKHQSASSFHPFEVDLIADLVKHLPKYLQRVARRCVIHREIGVGCSIADIVATSMPTGAVRVPTPLSVRESVIVSVLRHNGPTRIDVLEHLCGMKPKTLREGELDRLVVNRVVTLGDGGRVALGSWSRAGSIVAIEAKLTRWLDALEQALAYRQFADRVYVALPADCVSPALRARQRFLSAGIGLLSVNGAIRCEIRASSSTQHDWRREYVYSHLLGAGLRGQPA